VIACQSVEFTRKQHYFHVETTLNLDGRVADK